MTKKLQILGSFGGTPAQPDYNQNDSTAADYIKNRPFYTGDLVVTELVDVIAAMAESGIDWDVQEFDDTNSMYMGFYDGTLEVGKEYAITINGNQYIATSTLENMGTDAICFGDFDAYFALMTGSGDGSDFNYLVVYSEMEGAGVIYKGTEAPTECKIYLREQELVKLDPKYLPEGGVGYVTTEAGIETFDIVKITNDLLENDNGYGGLDALPPEEAPTEALWIDGYLETYELPLPFKLVAGQEYKVSINNISYTSTAVIRNIEDFEYVCIGDIDEALSENFADLRFVMQYEEFDGGVALITMINAAAFDLTDAPAEINISCPGQIEVVHKIDSKFLPNDIGGNGASNVQSDWNENNPEADSYIKNRPFYEYKDYAYIPGDTLLEEQNFVIDDDYVQISNELTFVTGEKYIVVFNGEQYKCVAWDNGDGVYLIGNGNIYGSEGMGEDVPFVCDSYDNGDCYLNVTEPGEYTISINELESEEEIVAVKKIDKKFLPDDMGSNPDWNQNDETAPDYIKNRPFYKRGKIDREILSEQTVTVENGEVKISDSLMLVAGQSYKFTFNGELYERIAEVGVPAPDCVGINDDENFTLYSWENSWGNGECYLCAADGDYVIKLVAIDDDIVKINSEYLPDVTWNNLLDKPFEDEEIIYEWPAGYSITSASNASSYDMYKLSYDTPSADLFIGKIHRTHHDYYNSPFIVEHYEHLITAADIKVLDEDVYEFLDYVVVGCDVYNYDSYTLTKGIWCGTHTRNDYSAIINPAKKIDTKFIPNMDWNENNSNRGGYIKNRTHYAYSSGFKWDGQHDEELWDNNFFCRMDADNQIEYLTNEKIKEATVTLCITTNGVTEDYTVNIADHLIGSVFTEDVAIVEIYDTKIECTAILVVRKDNLEFNGIQLPTAGIYFAKYTLPDDENKSFYVKELRYPDFVKQLSEIYIPDTIVHSPLTAQVGQTIVVKTVDENGRPTDWECVDLPTGSGLPPVTAEDEGKILRVVNGVPTWVSLPYAEEAEF